MIDISFTESEAKTLTAARKILAQKVNEVIDTDPDNLRLSKLVLTTYSDASGSLHFIQQSNGPLYYDLINNSKRVYPLYYTDFTAINMIKALESLSEFVSAWATIVANNHSYDTRYTNVMMNDNKVKAVKTTPHKVLASDVIRDADFFVITDTIETLQRSWTIYKERNSRPSLEEFICNIMKKYKVQFP